MRVLFNTYPVAFDCPGGGEIQLLRSQEALERAGVEVLRFDPWQPQFDRADVVHFFSVVGGSACFCDHVKRRGLPLVLSPVLWLTTENQRTMPLGEIGALLHLADRILPNSQAELDQLAAHFGLRPEKMTITYNAVDPMFASPVDPDDFRRHFAITRPFVLNVANVEPRKNQLALARVALELGVDLVVLGHVREPTYLAACAAAGGPSWKYLGPVAHGGALLRAAYRACAAFVLPSLLETPGLAALEAALAGAAVVVTEVGSAREYFADLATYVNPLDPATIRQGIEAALARPADGRLRQWISERFTWDRTAQQLRAAYAEVLGPPGKPAHHA